jgi:hypothetical protein
MKYTERMQAQSLRRGGLSIGEIAQRLSVAKSSVSLWVRDVPLTLTQRTRLSRNGYSVDLIERRREKRLSNLTATRETIIQRAAQDIKTLSPKALLLVGAALYWGEGGKTVRGGVRLSNSDPTVIAVMMRFFREVCKVPEEKFRGHVHTFSHLNVEAAEKYWAKISSVPRKRFYKTYSKPSIASKGKKDNLPFGTFQIYVHNTKLFFKIMGWIEGLKKLDTKS